MPLPLARPSTPKKPSSRLFHQRRRYAFGTPGITHVVLSLLVAVGAFNSQNNLLFLTFGFGLGLMIVSGLLSGAMLMGLEVTREHVADARAGETFTLRYRVRNHNRYFPAAFALTIREAGLEPARPRFWLVRLFSRHLLQPPSAKVEPPTAFAPYVAPSRTVRVDAGGRAISRGIVPLTTIRVTTGFPFGLMLKTLEFDQPDELVITPQPIEVRAADAAISDRGAVSGALTRRPGLGDEFLALREYAPGDPPRSIAWRASARRGSLLVRQLAAPAPRRLWIVLFVRTRPGTAVLDERAIGLASGAVEAGIRAGFAVGLCVPASGQILLPHAGAPYRAALQNTLGRLELDADDGRARDLPFPLQAADRASRLVVVTSDREAPVPAAIARRAVLLVAQGNEHPVPPRPTPLRDARPASEAVS